MSSTILKTLLGRREVHSTDSIVMLEYPSTIIYYSFSNVFIKPSLNAVRSITPLENYTNIPYDLLTLY